MALRWRIAILISVAIAISYLDRQTLPVAIKAISKDIPLSNEQFSDLQSAFLLSYAFMYAGGGKLVDALGTRLGFTLIMAFWSLACVEPFAGGNVCDADGQPVPAGRGRRRRFSGGHARCVRMVPGA